MKLRIIIITVLALISTQIEINAQEQSHELNDRTVIVELNTGTVIEGTINEWQIGEFIDIKTTWSESMVLPSTAIKKVIQKSTLGLTETRHYQFKEKGLYYSGKIQFIAGNEGPRAKAVNGLGVSFSAGHRFNRFASLGLGVGYDRFIWDSGENMIPIFLEYTSFFSAKNTSLFANVQTGYSLAFEDSEYLLVEAKGGFMIYPSLGLRLGRYENKFTIDFGYKFQNAELTYRDQWSTAIAEQRLTYKRLTLRLGILL